MGYQVLNIKSLGSLGKLTKSLDISFTAQIKQKKLIMFSGSWQFSLNRVSIS